MTNDAYLLLAPGDDADSISRLMKILAARQTRYVNKLEKRSGTLWEGCFKAGLIDSDSYLVACYRYVDLNPARARIVNTPMKYPWSSFGDRVGLTSTGRLEDAPSFRVGANDDRSPSEQGVVFLHTLKAGPQRCQKNQK